MNEIDDLLKRIETPSADVADDVARGTQALRRRHGWQVAAAALSVLTLAGAAFAVGNHTSGSREAGLAGRSGAATASALPAQHTAHPKKQAHGHRHEQMTGLSGMGALRHYRAVLADHLDPHGDRLAPPSNEQGGGGMLGTKLDWNHGGMLEIVVGRSWAAAGGFYLLEDAGMSPTTYDGHPARVSTTGDDTVVSVQHADGTVVTLIASTSFGNNGTSTSDTGLTQHQLLAAAADPRLTLPSDAG
jgi:hypothetical protein